MKWINHQIVTGFIIFAATDEALFVASSIVGAVIPDKVEGNPPKESKAYWQWRKNHRTWSHYPVIYLALIALLMFGKDYFSDPTISLVAEMLIFVLIGSLLHIVEDGICGRVPIFTPNSKHGIKLFSVGSIGEYICAAFIVLICVFSRFGSIEELINLIMSAVNHF